MSTICNIKFIDHEQGVYYPGEILKCNVELITKEAQRIKDIAALVTGKGEVQWEEGGNKTKVIYTSEIVYFSFRNVLQNDPTNNIFELMPGNHWYTFEIQLPPKLASSFKGLHGQIQYAVKLIISREITSDNNEFVQPFTIITPLDLNSNENSLYKAPIDVTTEKNKYLYFFNMNPFKMRIRIPYSAFVPGQSIPCIIDAENESKLECHGIKVKIHMHVKYTADFPSEKTNEERIKIQKVVLNKVAIGTKENFTTSLSVPVTPPSSLDVCKIINLSYTVTVEAMMEGIHGNLVYSIPITIGTHPLHETVQNMGQGPNIGQVPNFGPNINQGPNIGQGPNIDQNPNISQAPNMGDSSTENPLAGFLNSLLKSIIPQANEEGRVMETQTSKDDDSKTNNKDTPVNPLYPVLPQPETIFNAPVNNSKN